MKLGHVLVIDEADKAPTNVTCILKTLVESGEMILADGRRILSGAFTHSYTIEMTEKRLWMMQHKQSPARYNYAKRVHLLKEECDTFRT